jgi:hypothetical protein
MTIDTVRLLLACFVVVLIAWMWIGVLGLLFDFLVWPIIRAVRRTISHRNRR